MAYLTRHQRPDTIHAGQLHGKFIVAFMALVFLVCQTWTAGAQVSVDKHSTATQTITGQGIVPGARLLRLARGSFDPLTTPLQERPGLRSGLLAKATGDEYYIIQLRGPVLPEWKKALLAAGAQLHDYIPDYAFLARLSGSAKKAVEGLDFVRWVGPYLPAHRLAPSIARRFESAVAAPGVAHAGEAGENVIVRETKAPTELDVVIVLFKGTDMTATSRSIVSLGGRILDAVDGKYKEKVVATVPVTAIGDIAVLPGVKWIEPKPVWKLFNNVAATMMGARYQWDTHGLHGSGQVVAVADTGLDQGSTSPGSLLDDFEDGSGNSRVITILDTAGDGNKSDTNGHGTHVAGSVLGNGMDSGSTPSTHTYPDTAVVGMAPESSLVFQATMNNSSGGLVIPSDLNTLFNAAWAQGATIHTNSWGSSVYSAYDSECQDVDENSWDNKNFTILFAAGNEGVDTDADGVIDRFSIGSPAGAKDCITVGASENDRSGQQYEYPQNTCNTATWGWFDSQSFSTSPIYGDGMSDDPVGIAAFSSRGPVLDDRVKPDIVAPGTFVLSVKSSLVSWSQWGQCGLSSDLKPYYLFMGGTSMATPLTAGLCALIREYFTDGNYAGITNPSSALIKAMLINSALDLSPGQYGTGATREIPTTRPNDVEGWGRPRLDQGLFPVSPRNNIIYDISPGLSTDGQGTYNFIVNDSSYPLNVTLVWTDYPGSPVSGGGLVNDLDLELVTPTTTLYPDNARKRVNTTCLYYDDGYWDGAGSMTPGRGRAARFASGTSDRTLRSIRYYLVATTSGAHTGVINVWRGNGTGGLPGTQLYTKSLSVRMTYAGSYYEQWITAEPSGVIIPSGEPFYVEFRSNSNSTYLAYDTTGIDTGNDYYYNGSSWAVDSSDTSRDYFIEAVVSDADVAGNADHVNNVEGIDVASPETGSWSARVKGYNVPQGPQPFALVISGAVEVDNTILEIAVSPSAWDIGPRALGAVVESDTVVTTNTGNVAEDFAISGTDGAGGWLLQSAQGVNAFRVDVDKDKNGSYDFVLAKSEGTLAADVEVGGVRTLGLKYGAPTLDTIGAGVAQNFVITIKASRYVP